MFRRPPEADSTHEAHAVCSSRLPRSVDTVPPSNVGTDLPSSEGSKCPEKTLGIEEAGDLEILMGTNEKAPTKACSL